jgi:hypothetical protein
MKKNDKKPIIETHGKVETFEPTTLEQVWGFSEMSKYETDNEETYKNKLLDMTRSDLENHARRLGVLVVESTARLRDKLIQDFRTTQSLSRKPVVAKHNDVKPSAEVLKILAEGR